MKNILLSLSLLFSIQLSSAQDLTGYWKGTLPQDDKRYDWYMEAMIIHRNDSI